jgi:hypothetical protein
VFLIDPNGTETPLEYSIFHQYYGRDYPENPINEISAEQIGTDEFPTGGRNLTYIEVTFTPQTEGYYQVFFHRDRNVPETGGNEGRAIADLVKAYIFVGNAAPTEEAGFGRLSSINRTEIRPVSDVGRLATGSDFEGFVLFGGEPVVAQEIRLEIDAHEYVSAETDADGRFSVALPHEAGEFAIRVVQDWEEGGTWHEQDYTSRREIHILQIATTAEIAEIAEEVAEEIEYEPEHEPEYVTPVAISDELPPAAAPPVGEIPQLFESSHYLMFALGGLLMLAAGFLFGFGVAKLKK